MKPFQTANAYTCTSDMLSAVHGPDHLAIDKVALEWWEDPNVEGPTVQSSSTIPRGDDSSSCAISWLSPYNTTRHEFVF